MTRDRIDAVEAAAAHREGALRRESAAPPGFAELARLAAALCHAPLASIELDGWSESWFSAGGLPLGGLPSNPFREATLRADGAIEIDAQDAEDHLARSGAVLHAAGIRGYAGCALRTDAGESIGTIGVYYAACPAPSPDRRAGLAALARQGVALAELARRVTELELLGGNGQVPHRSGASQGAALTNALLDSAPVAIYYADTQSQLAYVNPEYRRMFRLAPGQSVDDWPQAVHPEDRARIERTWADFLRDPRAMRLEYRALADDGTVRYFAEQVATTQGLTGYVGTISDITDLVNARTLLEAVIGDLPVALMACDAGGRITHRNRAADELCCAGPDDEGFAARVLLMDGVTPVAGKDQPLARALRGETITNLELLIAPHGAAPRSTLSSARRLAGPDGQTLGAVSVIQDTTERKRRESELERVHRELVAASREAGRAEVATNVLHDVGNILNSVNVSASLVAERLRHSSTTGIARAVELLRAQEPDAGPFPPHDARGAKALEYLLALAQQLCDDRREALGELELLRENLDHIKEAVMMPQSRARLCGVAETVNLADLVEDSLRLHAGACARHGVCLRREILDAAPIAVDKHKVLQILVNLIRNAQHACEESGRPDKLITLRVERAPRGARVCVIDNGVGIAPQNMAQLFRRGFTTRESGHGFGLHSGALAAQELGGALRAESAGAGCGATFILELPLAPPPG